MESQGSPETYEEQVEMSDGATKETPHNAEENKDHTERTLNIEPTANANSAKDLVQAAQLAQALNEVDQEKESVTEDEPIIESLEQVEPHQSIFIRFFKNIARFFQMIFKRKNLK